MYIPGRDLSVNVPRDDIGARALPTWDALDTTSGLRTGAGAYVAFDAVVGGWITVTWWQANVASASARYIVANGAGSSRGFALFQAADDSVRWRVLNAVGVAAEVNVGQPVVGRFNVALCELDIVGGFVYATLNNGTRTAVAIAGHTPTDATDRVGIDTRQNLTSGLGTDGGVHCAVMDTAATLSASERLIFWASKAKLAGQGNWGLGGEAFNPVADKKWTAHVLTDSIGGTVMTKAGTVLDATHPRVFAW